MLTTLDIHLVNPKQTVVPDNHNFDFKIKFQRVGTKYKQAQFSLLMCHQGRLD